MKIIERYILTSFLTAFFLAWMVFSFVLTIGLLVKIAQLIMRGVPLSTIGTFMLIGFPGTLALTIPLSLLVSSLLIFSRLSADSEISAMRACGINLLSVMKYPILFAVLCTFLSVFINNEIVPRSAEARKKLRNTISVEVGLDLLEPGKIISDFPKVKLFFAKKQGNWLYDILAFDNSKPGLSREIRAEKALVSTNGTDIILDLQNVRVSPLDIDKPGTATASRFRHVISNAITQRTFTRNIKMLHFFEIREAIEALKANRDKLPEDIRRIELCEHRTRYQRRFVEACAAFCFVLIGIPLGIKTQRKDSTIGIAISLVVSLSFYLFIILGESFQETPWMYPYYLIWLPVVACLGLAAYLIPKNL